MEQLTNFVTEAGIEVVTIIVGALLSSLAVKLHSVLNQVKKKDQLGIIDVITDRVVEYTEAELRGSLGQQKRDFAVDKAIEILATKGIKVSREEVIAGIENGVNKLNKMQR